MKHPIISPLLDAMRDLLCASEDYLLALTRPSVRIACIDNDAQTGADLVEKGRELSAQHLRARNVLSDVVAAMLEDERETMPALPNDDDDATDDARSSARKLTDPEIRDRAALAAARLAGKKIE
jgi:hypothetical protein